MELSDPDHAVALTILDGVQIPTHHDCQQCTASMRQSNDLWYQERVLSYESPAWHATPCRRQIEYVHPAQLELT
jgi:hypothetical protein